MIFSLSAAMVIIAKTLQRGDGQRVSGGVPLLLIVYIITHDAS